MAALILFTIVMLSIALIGIFVVKGIHLSVTALQAECIIIFGCICITSFTLVVLAYGLRFNSLLVKHQTYLAQSQLSLLKEAYLKPHDLDLASDFLGVVDTVKDNLQRDDRLFSIFGYSVDDGQVKKIQAAVFSLVALGVTSTLAFLRQSL